VNFYAFLGGCQQGGFSGHSCVRWSGCLTLGERADDDYLLQFLAMTPLVLLAMLVAVPSKGPAPTPSAGQAKQEQARPAQGKPETDQSTKKRVTTVPQSKPEITVGSEQRFGDQDKNSSPWRDWPAWAVAFFTLGLLIVAVLQWAAMHGQRQLMGDQLAEMKTTSADTHDLAIAAKDAAAAAQQQSRSAEHTVDAMLRQESVMETQTKAMIGQLEAAILSVKAAEESAATTRKQLEAYERPWVTGTFNSKDGISFDAGGNLHASFDYSVKNVGKSVATEVRAEAQAKAIRNGTSKNELKVILAAIENPGNFIGFTLFPGESHPMLWPVEISRDEIRAMCFEAEDGDTYFAMVLLVAIFYRFPTSDSWHETRFSYVIGGSSRKNRISVRYGTTLLPSDLEMHKVGGDVAT
jgi:hypothetical protein